MMRKYFASSYVRFFLIGLESQRDLSYVPSLKPNEEASRQTDVIICDQYFNAPIYRELAGEVHPIETVCAIVEVKGTLSKYHRKDGKTDIERTLESITIVRRLAQHKSDVEYVPVQKKGNSISGTVVGKIRKRIPLAPRAYLFAYRERGWKDIDSFKEELRQGLKNYPDAHIHGVAILKNNWFIHQEAYTGDAPTLHMYDDNCLLRYLFQHGEKLILCDYAFFNQQLGKGISLD
jgi:hypothetical protein